MAPKPMQHIDERRLEDDVVYRVQYLSEFMGFGPDDIQAIHAAAPHLAPLVPGIVDAVYDKLFSFDATKRHFVPRQHGYEGMAPEDLASLTLDHPQVAFRKNHLSQYLVKVVTSPYDGKMFQYLDWVGRIHTAKAGNPHIHVPIVQIGALFGFVNDALTATIQSLPLPQADRDRTVRAFTKLLWLQSDLFVKHYVAHA